MVVVVTGECVHTNLCLHLAAFVGSSALWRLGVQGCLAADLCAMSDSDGPPPLVESSDSDGPPPPNGGWTGVMDTPEEDEMKDIIEMAKKLALEKKKEMAAKAAAGAADTEHVAAREASTSSMMQASDNTGNRRERRAKKQREQKEQKAKAKAKTKAKASA